MDFDSELKSNLFCVRGDILLPGDSSLAYLLLNATLCQGSIAKFSTRYLLMDLDPRKDHSFEIAKNVKIPTGEYVCILEAEGPLGLLAKESRKVSLVFEQEPVFELIPWPKDLDPDNRVSSNEDEQSRARVERTVQGKLSDEELEEENSGIVTSKQEEPSSTADSLQASAASSQEEKGKFVGSITSKKYHRPDCRYAIKIKPDNRIYFQSREDAEAQGYLPCKVCNP